MAAPTVAHTSASGIDQLATKVAATASATLAVAQSTKVGALKSKLVEALGLDCSPHCLRLYKRSGARPGVVLRDGRTVRQSLTGGFEDKEVVVQLLRAEERLSDATLLIKFHVIDEGGVPGPAELVHAQSAWSASELLTSLAAVTAIPIDELALAKPPTVGANAITAALVAKLKWDDPKLLATRKISSHPMQLRDGDSLVLRRRGAGGGAPAGAAPAVAGGASRAKPWQGRGRGARSNDVTVVAGAGARPSRPERGVVIHTMYDDADVKPLATEAEAQAQAHAKGSQGAPSS